MTKSDSMVRYNRILDEDVQLIEEVIEEQDDNELHAEQRLTWNFLP